MQRLHEDDLRWADMAMVSARVAQRDSTTAVIDRCSKAGLTIVAGGPLFLGEHESFAQVDHFVLDEGECTLPRFLRDWEAGTPERIYRADGYADLTLTPLPRWELADLSKYSDMCIQFSRGCPFDCEFQNTAILAPPARQERRGIAELDGLYALGYGGVFSRQLYRQQAGAQRGAARADRLAPGQKGFGFHEVSVNRPTTRVA